MDVHDVLVFKAAHHVGNRVSHAYVCQELIAEALALGSAFHETRDVDELKGCIETLLRALDFREACESLVGNCHHADVGLDGAERKVGRFGASAGKRVKECGLAHVGKTDDTHFYCHGGVKQTRGSGEVKTLLVVTPHNI